MSCPRVIKVVTPGPPGPIGSSWLPGDGAPDAQLGSPGDFYLDRLSGDIYGPRSEDESDPWGEVILTVGDASPGDGGQGGREVELQASSTHIQWRYVGDQTWISLVALQDLQGDDGPNIELRSNATHVQWRVVGAANWINLIALNDLKGPPGDDSQLPGVVTTIAAGLAPATGFGVIPYDANTEINFTALNGQVNTITLEGSLSLTGTVYANGLMLSLRLIAGAADRTVSFFVDWKPVGDNPPVTIPANKVAIFSAWCFGANAADVVYGIAIQP